MDLCTHGSPSEEAARRLARMLTSDSPRLAVSGGSALTVLPLLRVLMGPAHAALRLTYADERAVPFESDQSNAGATRTFVSGVRDELRLYRDGESLEQAQVRASRAFDERFGGLDAVLLGLGADGHIASHFTGVDVEPTDVPVQLVRDSPKPPRERLTLSMDVLAATEAVIFATGEGKRAAIEAALGGGTTLPTARLKRCTIVTDLAI